ncbi:MAG TPA: aldo/keto reductase [Stellaceae bacterium]|jgi:aryl-alcohol dehydrogenase-like predicted oxidoreductase|nr:aldo/keto reductase [Stellaceae bacterium]
MHSRPLGRSGLSVSEIGFGAWGIGGRTAGETSYGDTDDRRSLAALDRALDLGITFYDTAPAYGDGHSEALIGEAFARRRDRVVIATKAGLPRFGEASDFSPAALRDSLEGSLRRLKTDYVDLFQLHNPPPDLFSAAPESYAALEDLRRAGKIRAIGVSVKSPAEALAIFTGHAVAAVQLNLNMLDVRAIETGLLEHAAAAGVAIIARTPLCFGFLSGAVTAATEFPPGDHRRAWPRAQIERWVKGAATMQAATEAPANQSQSQAALRFCLSFPAVATVIPGILSPEEALENAAASDFGPLADVARDRIVALNREVELFAR